MKDIYRWVPTDVQMADHLTKVKPQHELRQLLNENHLALMSTEPENAAAEADAESWLVVHTAECEHSQRVARLF